MKRRHSARPAAPPRRLRQFGPLWLAASSVPLLSMAASAIVNADPRSWASMPSPLLAALVDDARLYSAVSIVVASPLAGVAVASSRRARTPAGSAAAEALSTAWPLLPAVLLYTAASALLTLVAAGLHDAALAATSHATTAAVALALAAFGAFCGAAFADPLDAAACSLLIVLAAAGGLLAAGAWVDVAPSWLIDLALLASPLVAMTSAGGIDILRMDALYRMSPLAHLGIDYPTWRAACAWYLSLSALGFVGLTWKCRGVRTAITRGKDIPA